MKNKKPLLSVAAFAVAISTSLQVQAANYIYKAQSAVEEGSQILLPDTSNTWKLHLPNKEGVSLGGKPTVGEDEKSLVFSGRQVAAFSSVDRIPSALTGFQCEFSFFLNPEAASIIRNQAVIRHSNWEIRCDTERGTLAVIIWHADAEKKYTTSQVSIQSGVWQRISVSLKGSVLTVSVNGTPTQFDISLPIDGGRPPGSFTMGAAANSAENRAPEAFRPLCGSLADINITLE
jgi:hypothetical protein